MKLKPIEASQYAVLAVIGLSGLWLLRAQLGFHSSGDSGVHQGHFAQATNDVRVKPPSEVAWHPAFAQSGIDYGDQVFVGEKSRALIELPDVKVEVQPDSLLNLSKDLDKSSVDILKGQMNLNLTQSSPIKLAVAGQSLTVQGDKSELNVSRNANELGISFVQGESSLILPSGETVKSEVGGSVVASTIAGQAIHLEKYSIVSKTPANDLAFIAGSPIDFKWVAQGKGLHSIRFQMANTKSFDRLLKNESAESSVYQIKAPNEPGLYFWRAAAETPSGVKVFGERRRFAVIELRAVKMTDPLFEFVNPGTYRMKAILEEMDFVSRYRLQIAADRNFDQFIFNGTSESPQVEVVFKQKWGRVFARARAEYDSIKANAPWSEIVAFDIPKPLDPPHLQFAYDPKTKMIATTWEPIASATSYVIDVAPTPSFKKTVPTEAKTEAAEIACRPGFVRVSAHQGGVYGFFSPTLAMPKCVPPLLIQDAVLYPAYLPRFHKRPKPFITASVKGSRVVQSYSLEVALNPEFAGANVRKPRELAVEEPVARLGTYFLRAIQNLDRKKFAIAYSPTLPVKVFAAPKAPLPLLDSPVDGETFFVRSDLKAPLYLKWKSEPGAVGYDIELSRDKDFKKALGRLTTSNLWLALSSRLSGDIFWRVRSYTLYYESPWTEVRQLKVLSGR